jgi:hypothetical protein
MVRVSTRVLRQFDKLTAGKLTTCRLQFSSAGAKVADFLLDIVLRNRVGAGQLPELGGYALPRFGKFCGTSSLWADGHFNFRARRKRNADDANIALRLDGSRGFKSLHIVIVAYVARAEGGKTVD